MRIIRHIYEALKLILGVFTILIDYVPDMQYTCLTMCITFSQSLNGTTKVWAFGLRSCKDVELSVAQESCLNIVKTRNNHIFSHK